MHDHQKRGLKMYIPSIFYLYRSSNSPDHGRDGPSLALTIGIVAPLVVLLILATVLIYKALGFRRKRKARKKYPFLSSELIYNQIALNFLCELFLWP